MKNHRITIIKKNQEIPLTIREAEKLVDEIESILRELNEKDIDTVKIFMNE
jgi:hypothetical protein